MRQSHLIAYNTLLIWASRVLQIIPQLILVPYLIHHIGDSGYGTYTLIWSLMLAIDRVEQSLQQGVIKYSAAFAAQKRIEEVNKVISSSFVYSVLLAIVVCIVILSAGRFYPYAPEQMNSLLIVISITILLVIPLTPYKGIVLSQQRHYADALSETASKYMNLIMVFVWYHFIGPSILALVVISCVMLILSRFIQVPIAYHLVTGLHNRPANFDRQMLKTVAAFGGMAVLTALCLIANNAGIRWLMGILISPSFVAHLAIIMMPVILLTQIVTASTITVMPATSAYEAKGNLQLLEELLIRSIRYSAILALTGLLAGVILIRQVLIIWIGNEYAFLAPYMITLFISSSFMLSTSTAHHMLKGLGKLRTTLFIYLTALVVLPVGLILIMLEMQYNPYLAVTSGLASGYLACGCFHIGFAAKVMKVRLQEILVRGYVQPITAAVISAIVTGLIYFGRTENSIARVFMSMTAVLLFLLIIYFFVTTQEERRQFKDFVCVLKERITFLFQRPFTSRHNKTDDKSIFPEGYAKSGKEHS